MQEAGLNQTHIRFKFRRKLQSCDSFDRDITVSSIFYILKYILIHLEFAEHIIFQSHLELDSCAASIVYSMYYVFAFVMMVLFVSFGFYALLRVYGTHMYLVYYHSRTFSSR